LFSNTNFLSFILFAKDPVTEGETDPIMLDLDPYMIEALRGSNKKGRFGTEGSINHLMQEQEFQKLINKHDLHLFNGPIVGAVGDSSAKIWIRSSKLATFYVKVDGFQSELITTTAASDCTGVAILNGLKSFTEYKYSIILDGKEITKDYFHFKTAPKQGEAVKFNISFGSGARYQPQNEGIWRTLAQTRPIAYLGLGDNVYIDATR